MPWFSIVTWILSYFLSSKAGASKGQAALIATGAAAGAYYLADPANKDNVLGFGSAEKDVPGDLSTTSPDGKSWAGAFGQVGSAAVNGVANTAQSWGPLGTVGAVAAGSALADDQKNWIWIAAIVGVIFLLK